MNGIFNHYFRYLCTLFLLVPLVSCEKSDNDQLLKEELIGTWRSTNSYYKSYSFFDDNTFIDTSFYLNSNNPKGFEVLEIISGDYTIHDRLLMFSNISLVYEKSQGELAGVTRTYDNRYLVSFNADILVLNQKDTFTPLNNDRSGIVGRWAHNKLFAVLDNSTDKIFTGDQLKGTYEFKSDLTVTWKYIYYYNNIENTGGSTATYELENSNLTINNWSLYNLSVSFTKGEMVWIYGDRTFSRIQ